MHLYSFVALVATALALHTSVAHPAQPASTFATVSAREPGPGPAAGNIEYHKDPTTPFLHDDEDKNNENDLKGLFTGHGAAVIGISPPQPQPHTQPEPEPSLHSRGEDIPARLDQWEEPAYDLEAGPARARLQGGRNDSAY